jgi:serine/threonine-protein kinase
MTTMLDPMIGVVLPRRYRIIELLGRGSMSVVYKGTYEPLDQLVAVKILKSHLVSDPHQIKRFQQEIKTAGSLSHPNIIGILDFGVTDQGVPYLIMEYLAGKSIADLLDEQERLSVNRVIKIFAQAADGLGYAHREGVVHRDIKPSNMLVVDTDEDTDVVKIVDFGIAKIQSAAGKDVAGQDLTSTGEVLGTPLYMSPEQAQGKDLDGRSDIYSLGCVMYHALTGRPPFVGETALDTMRLQITAVATPIEIVRPDLYFPERLQQILTKALAKDPRMRYQRMEHFKADLESCMRKDTASSSRIGVMHHAQAAQPVQVVPERPSFGISLTLPVICVIVGLTIGIGTAFWAITTDIGKKDPKIRMPLPVASHGPTQDDLTAGETALNEGRYEDAEKALVDAKAETSKAKQPDENYARTMIALARLYYQEDKLEQSEQACIEALKTARALAPNSAMVADVLTNLSRVQCANGKYKDAEATANEAVALLQKINGADTAEIASGLQALAEIACKRGDIAKGSEYLERADQIAEKAHGEDNLDVASILNDLGMVRERQKSYSAANTLFARALGIRQKLLGTQHPLVSDTQCAMGTLNFNMRNYDSAEAMFNNALDIRLKAFGEKSSKTAEIYSCLAILYDTERKYPQAEECYRKAVEIRQAVWGPDSPRLARSLEHLARFLREHGQANGAEVYEAQLKRIQAKSRA